MRVRVVLTIPVFIIAMLAAPGVSSAQSIGPITPPPPRTLYPPTQLVHNGGTTSGWMHEGPYDLSQFRGFTVQLRFDVNGNGNTVFGLDDVSVLTSYPQNVINLPGLC